MTLTQLRLVLYLALATALAIVIAAGWPAGGARPGFFAAHGNGPGVPGELVVHFRDGTSPQQREALLELRGATVKREMSLPGYYVVEVAAGSEMDAGQALASSPAVASVDRSVLREPAAAPTDPYYGQQWNMTEIGLEAAREITTGVGAVVAIIDTGVAYENYVNASDNQTYGAAPDLAATHFVDPCDATGTVPCSCATESVSCQCESGSPPCINAIRKQHANDDFGHGTHIAGTVSQDTNNNYGAAGIAPSAAIMPIKVCLHLGASYGCPPADIADGVNYAVQQGADVINMSITGEPDDGISEAEREALARAEAAGIPVVAAAGNYGDNRLGYPAAVDSVISVGSVGMGLAKASYSSYGRGEGDSTLDIVAPGGDPVSEGGGSYIWQQSYGTCVSATNYTTFPEVTSCYGTSMSAGHVSGVIALIVSVFPNVGLDDIREILSCSAQDLGDPGTDLRFGVGLVRADRALADIDRDHIQDCVDDFVPTPTPSPGPTFAPPTDNCLSPSITPSPSPSPTPEPTLEPTPTETAVPTDTPERTETMPPTDTPTPSPTEPPTPTPDPMATPTPTPTLTAEPPSPPPPVTPSPEPTLFLPGCGDVDCSGFVNSMDALDVVAWSSGSGAAPQCIGLGYVTCDSALNAADAVAILAYAGGLRNNTSCGPHE